MVVDINNAKLVRAFKETLHEQVLIRLGGYNLEKKDIDNVVNYMFNKVKAEYVDARVLNATFHQALADLGITRRNVFPSTRFQTEESAGKRVSL